nr:hypothetical protein Q903MT_gene2964 [Picea sitchensis]
MIDANSCGGGSIENACWSDVTRYQLCCRVRIWWPHMHGSYLAAAFQSPIHGGTIGIPYTHILLVP